MRFSQSFIDEIAMLEPTENVDARTPKLSTPQFARVKDRTLSYTERHRGEYFTPEFDFKEIQIIQSRDSYTFRAINKKLNRFLTAGWTFTSKSNEALSYVKRRMKEIAFVSGYSWDQTVAEIAHDLIRFSNAMIVKVRSVKSSTGRIRKNFEGKDVMPVAAYFIAPFETLQLRTKPSGELDRIRQRMPTGSEQEFFAPDIVHFYTNRFKGFSVGTPELFPAIDDIELLRRIEENVEDLIESSLFPFMHYQIGSDTHPERTSPEGLKESDIVSNKLRSLPPGGVWVTDHRHKFTSIGTEGKALRIDYYLEYFKKRVFAALGVSAVDMGEGDTATRATANSMSKAALMDIEALQVNMKTFIDQFIIAELMLEGGFDPMDEEQIVQISFGIVDKEARVLLENQAIQVFINNGITVDEFRERLGHNPYTDEQLKRTFYHMFGETSTLARMASDPVSAAVLAENPASGVQPKHAAMAKTAAEAALKAKTKVQGRPGASKAGNASTAKARPSNQHGTTSGKTKDVEVDGKTITVPENANDRWLGLVEDRYNLVHSLGVERQCVANSLCYLLEDANE